MRQVVITGGTRGIGLACCERFVRAGDCVTATWSKDKESAEKAKALLPSVRFVQADVSSEKEVKALFERIPSLDVLVNNAGVHMFKLVQDTTLQEWEQIMGVNVGGAFLCAKYAAKKLMERGGAIVNVGSVWGEVGASCESAYSASKGALMAFTKALAKELAPMQVTANCVSPGAIDTKMNDSLSKEEKEELMKEIPLGRFGKSEEVAELIYFISCQKYITGQNISINGGWNC